ncbi:MAG: von Willebrand factor type A domain-containing protein [Chitinophagaceae bacterium]|nr:von Willebrand factor type A domain-containing protein [Chitinophagaceae bacterium]
MRLRLYHMLILCIALQANAQYYLRGEVRDENNQPLSNVRILLLSNHYTYYTGSFGSFGFTTNVLNDSLNLSLEGYETTTINVKSDQWQNLTMKVLASNVNRNKIRLVSVTKDLNQANRRPWTVNEETYFQLVENDFVDASRFPNTGFALNVNRASYSNVRRFIRIGSLVPPDAVRTEEMLNYFNLGYKEPKNGDIFGMESMLGSCPWDAEKQLLCQCQCEEAGP